MPDNASENKSQQSIENQSPAQKDIGVYTQELLHSLKDSTADDEKALTALVTKRENTYSHDFAIDMLKQLTQADDKNEKNWLASCDCVPQELLSYMSKFNATKRLAGERYSIGELKTYCDSRILEKKSLKEEAAPKPKDITKDIKNLTGSTLETNQGAQKTKEQLKADNELQNKKYAEVKQTIAKHKKEILADKDFIEYKKSPDQQKLLKNVPLAKRDAYLVTRYALQSAAGDKTPAYLEDVKTSLGATNMEDILARLDKEYKVDAVLSKEFAQRDKSRFNKYKDIAENTIYNARSFDSKVPAETQKNIAEKGVSFDNVFGAAELEFYKENSPLRTTLDNLTITTLFPGSRNTDPKEYRSEQADGKVWVPTQQLKNKDSFDTWVQNLGIDKNTKQLLTQQYSFYSKIAVEGPVTLGNGQTLEPKRKEMLKKRIETNMALIASQNRRRDVEAETSKSMAERIFQDVDTLIRPEQGSAEKWKIIPQKDKAPFAILPVWRWFLTVWCKNQSCNISFS